MSQRQQVIEFLENIKAIAPIEWDRFTFDDTGYDVFGWIERKDGKRDFVAVQLCFEEGEMSGHFMTSSAKYSEAIHEYMFETKDGHNDCILVEHLYNDGL